MSVPSWWADLLAASDALATTDRAQVQDWNSATESIRTQKLRNDPETAEEELPAVDDPPLTVRLGALGAAFATSKNMTNAERVRVLAVVEKVLDSGDDAERTAVVTGFLEPVLNYSDKFDLHALWGFVGPLTQHQCVELQTGWGIDVPDWMAAATQ